MNVEIMRTFVELRRMAAGYATLEKRFDQLEREASSKLGEHEEKLGQIFKTLRHLISPPSQQKRPVGFRIREDDE